MSWSTSSIAVPARRLGAAAAPAPCSLGRRARPPARRDQDPRLGAQRACDPHELSLSLRELGRHRVCVSLKTSNASRGAASVLTTASEKTSLSVVPTDGRCEADNEVPRTLTSSKELDRLPGPRPPEPRTRVRLEPRDALPSRSNAAAVLDEAGDGVMKASCPRRWGADQPTSWPSSTARSTSSTAWTPAEVTEIPSCPGRRSSRIAPASRSLAATETKRRKAASPPAVVEAFLLSCFFRWRCGMPRIDEQGDDQREAAGRGAPRLPERAEPSSKPCGRGLRSRRRRRRCARRPS